MTFQRHQLYNQTLPKNAMICKHFLNFPEGQTQILFSDWASLSSGSSSTANF